MKPTQNSSIRSFSVRNDVRTGKIIVEKRIKQAVRFTPGWKMLKLMVYPGPRKGMRILSFATFFKYHRKMAGKPFVWHRSNSLPCIIF
jgi:hypothetical protein